MTRITRIYTDNKAGFRCLGKATVEATAKASQPQANSSQRTAKAEEADKSKSGRSITP